MPAKLALLQLSVPSPWVDRSSYRFREDRVASQVNNVRALLNKVLQRKPNIIVMPELSLPDRMIPELTRIATKYNAYIVAGFEYTKELMNICRVFTPFGSIHEYAKIHRSKYDHPNMVEGNQVNVFTNSGYGDFAVLICFDYTDGDLVHLVRGKVDIILVVSANPDTKTFSERALRDCYDGFCYVAICNYSQHACSGVYAPKQGSKVVRKLTREQDGCLLTRLDVVGLRKGVSPLMELKSPPPLARTYLVAPPFSGRQTVLDPSDIAGLFLVSALRLLGGHERWKGSAARLRILGRLRGGSAGFERLLYTSLLSRSRFHGIMRSLCQQDYIAKRRGHTYRLTDKGGRLYEVLLEVLVPIMRYSNETYSSDSLPPDYKSTLRNLETKQGLESTLDALDTLIKNMDELNETNQASSGDRVLPHVEDLLEFELNKIKRRSMGTAGNAP